MANGLKDVLSVYRESLASERQTRLAEMQLSLSALQFEAQQQFKVEGRRREDVILALEDATGAATDALSSDAALIASKLSNITEIAEAAVTDTGGFENPEKLITSLSDKRGKYQFSEADARSMVSVVQYQNLARVNPDLAEAAKNEAVAFGIRVAGDFDTYQRSGFDKESLKGMKFLTAMDKANVLYLGRRDKFPDPSKIDLSVDPFVGVSQATQALQNIQMEKREFGDQDYSIDRPITTAGLTQQEQGAIDFDALIDEASVSGQIDVGRGPAQEALSSIYAEGPEDLALGPINIDIQDEIRESGLGTAEDITELEELGLGSQIMGGPVDLGRSDEEILESISFLPGAKVKGVQSQLIDLAETISSKMDKLETEVTARDESIKEYKVIEKQYNWERSQYYKNIFGGEKGDARKNKKEMDRLGRILGKKGPPSEWTGNLRREYLDWKESQTGLTTAMLARKAPTGKETYSHSYEVVRLASDIKKLVKQREALGY
tara:strand:- start:1684 stop:3162 length:1479 start_codon:yes stop_codon:yes gene_type:complete